MYKMLVLDLDGTLVSSSGRITETDKAAVRAAEDAGSGSSSLPPGRTLRSPECSPSFRLPIRMSSRDPAPPSGGRRTIQSSSVT